MLKAMAKAYLFLLVFGAVVRFAVGWWPGHKGVWWGSESSSSQLILTPLGASTFASSDVKKSGEVERQFRVKNTGNPATVFVVSQSCTCVDVSIDTQELGRNEECTVSVLARWDGVSETQRAEVLLGARRPGMPEERLLIPVKTVFLKDLYSDPKFVQFPVDDPFSPVLLRINDRTASVPGDVSRQLTVKSLPSWVRMAAVDSRRVVDGADENVRQHAFEVVLADPASDGESTLGWIRLRVGSQELEVPCVRPRLPAPD